MSEVGGERVGEGENRGDRRELLASLAIDRSAPKPTARRPLKWLVGLAVVAGVAFVALLFPGDPFRAEPVADVQVRTVLAQASTAGGPSVLDATGYVVARRQATVSAKTTGKVVEVLIEEGDRVDDGQLLAVLDDSIPRAQFALAESQLESARAGLAELQVELKQAELDLDRTKGLAQRNLASQADLDRDALDVEGLIARLARANKDVLVAERSLAVQRQLLEDMEIRAPFAGVVVAKAAQPGEMISPVSAGGGFTRTGICTIVDMESLEVEVDVNEAYINRVREDQPVKVTLNAYPQDHYDARVIAIIPTADRSKATVRVRVGFLNRDGRVLPDMGVRVAFLDRSGDAASRREDGVLIPRTALGSSADGPFVLLVSDGRVRRLEVETAGQEGSRVRVLAGLASGDRIVADLSAEPASGLADGAAVKVMQ